MISKACGNPGECLPVSSASLTAAWSVEWESVEVQPVLSAETSLVASWETEIEQNMELDPQV